ncbi:MAG: PBP1A family penicillin-binding protein [Desulfovibrio sp.]|nr:MAG: PBP1A family penicillin-binding protein [Desulfovibrio sp.]
MLIALILVPSAGILGLYLHASKDLPDFKEITDYRPSLVTTVYARNGDVIGYLYREMRFLVTMDQVPEYLPKAILAIEDSGFYEHEGVDFMAIIRATLKNFMAGDIVQGGSTITQQLVKQLLLTSERDYQRKIKEAILAYRLENNLDKDEILTIYMNQVFFGANAYGVEAAARTFFGKHAMELTLAEAALIAGLPKAPSVYNPYNRPEAAKARQEQVLKQMLELGWITLQEHEQAVGQDLHYQEMEDPSWGQGAYYLEEVRRWLIENLNEQDLAAQGIELDAYGEDAVYECGLHVYTAMEPAHQEAAEAALRQGLEASTRRRGWRGPAARLAPLEYATFLGSQDIVPQDLEPGQWVKALVVNVSSVSAEVRLGEYQGRIGRETWEEFRGSVGLEPGDVVWASVLENGSEGAGDEQEMLSLSLEQWPQVQGALVSMEPPTGDVVALVGGYSFQASQFNRATQARRQPGSAFKPIVYSAALDEGFTPATVIYDTPLTIGDWSPKNYGGEFHGPTSFRSALVRSRNVVTVRIAQHIGIDAVIERAQVLGLEPDFPRVLPICLGAEAVRPINLCQAYSAFARDGSYVRPRFVLSVRNAWGEEILSTQTEAVPAISPENAYAMVRLLQQVVQFGTGRKALALDRPVAGKTGTTNNEVDAWFMGFSPYLLSGVYVGFDQLTPMGRGEAGAGAALPIWLDYRMDVEELYPEQDWEAPPGVEYATVNGRRMPHPPVEEEVSVVGSTDQDFDDSPEQDELLLEMF